MAAGACHTPGVGYELMFDPVAELATGVKDLAAEDRSGWAAPALTRRLQEIAAVSEALQIELVRVLATWDARSAWADDGAVTAVSWLGQHLPLSPAEATVLVRLARCAHRHPTVAAALQDGDLPLAHAKALARAERHHEDAFAAAVDDLVALAADLSARDYAQVVAAWADLVDDRAPADDGRRRFDTADTLGGMAHTTMFGPAEDAAIVRAAIEALDLLDPPELPGGPRSRAQRHYDIVIDLFRRALADRLGTDPTTPGGVDVIIDAATAAELTTHPDRLPLADADPLGDLLAPWRPDADTERRLRTCRRPDGTPTTAAVAAVLLCSGWVRRIIIDPTTGAPIDAGRAYRRYNARQRRLLAVRDGGCVFPGCTRGPRWCDAHHLHHWEDGGPTDLDNGALLCRRHHRLVHQGWTIARDPVTGTVTATGPDGRSWQRSPTLRC